MWGRLSVTLRVFAIYRPPTLLIVSTEPFWLQQKGFFAHPQSPRFKTLWFVCDRLREISSCLFWPKDERHNYHTFSTDSHKEHALFCTCEQWDIKQQLKSSLREWGVTKFVCTDIFFSGGSDMLGPLTSYDLSIQVPAPYRPVIPAVTEVRIQYRISPDNTNTISRIQVIRNKKNIR